nr:hypothetical protein CFP56_00728 [Quercus suber]
MFSAAQAEAQSRALPLHMSARHLIGGPEPPAADMPRCSRVEEWADGHPHLHTVHTGRHPRHPRQPRAGMPGHARHPAADVGCARETRVGRGWGVVGPARSVSSSHPVQNGGGWQGVWELGDVTSLLDAAVESAAGRRSLCICPVQANKTSDETRSSYPLAHGPCAGRVDRVPILTHPSPSDAPHVLASAPSS